VASTRTASGHPSSLVSGPPFAPRNQLSVKAGDRSLLKLKPRAAEIADGLRELLPMWHPSFEAALQAAGMSAARLEVCEKDEVMARPFASEREGVGAC
jgi:hypothetical protein